MSAVHKQEDSSVGLGRIWNKIMDKAFDNSDRRKFGIGILGQCLNRKWRRDRIDSDVKEQLADFSDHRYCAVKYLL